MIKSKSYNRIIFLTTLSLYLGLVLVGGVTPVVAQDSKKSADSNKISILAPSEGYVFAFDLNPIIKLNELAKNESLPVKLSGRLIPLPQKLTNWEIINSTGNQKIIDFLHKECFIPADLTLPGQPLFADEFFLSIEIDKANITLTQNIKFHEAGKATEMSEIFRKMSEYAKSPNASKDIAGNLYIVSTQARAENNQVFIVTRLPRAAIDDFLAAKDAQ